jgi:hypothetical protein
LLFLQFGHGIAEVQHHHHEHEQHHDGAGVDDDFQDAGKRCADAKKITPPPAAK